MINKSIHKLELEEMDDHFQCTIFYGRKHPNGEPYTAKLLITESQLADGRLRPNITAVMYEIGKLLVLEEENTLDFQMVKDVPDGVNVNNPVEVLQAPGRTFWLCEGYQAEDAISEK
ncbi:MAG: hypothetical protein ACW99G_12925 [Candidatus Thorarchaeota archaeon]|jgi:hypothetical protein